MKRGRRWGRSSGGGVCVLGRGGGNGQLVLHVRDHGEHDTKDGKKKQNWTGRRRSPRCRCAFLNKQDFHLDVSRETLLREKPYCQVPHPRPPPPPPKPSLHFSPCAAEPTDHPRRTCNTILGRRKGNGAGTGGGDRPLAALQEE